MSKPANLLRFDSALLGSGLVPCASSIFLPQGMAWGFHKLPAYFSAVLLRKTWVFAFGISAWGPEFMPLAWLFGRAWGFKKLE